MYIEKTNQLIFIRFPLTLIIELIASELWLNRDPAWDGDELSGWIPFSQSSKP